MTKNKTAPKKKDYFVKTTSKKTGAIILAVTLLLVALGSVFMFLAIQESDRLAKIENDWRLQSCQDMKKDFKENPEPWKHDAIVDKKC